MEGGNGPLRFTEMVMSVVAAFQDLGGDEELHAGDDLIEGGMKHIQQQLALPRQLAAFVAKDMLNDSEDEEQEQ